NNSGAFTDIAAGLPGVYRGTADWADVDGDGDLDAILTGANDSDIAISEIFLNDGDEFVAMDAGLIGVQLSALAPGDFDADGDLDLLVTGESASGLTSTLYVNEGGIFTAEQTAVPELRRGDLAWVDIDSDGDLDLFTSGETSSGGFADLFRNQEGVLEPTSSGIPAVVNGSLTCADYDNDGDQDLLVAGTVPGGSNVTKIYRNDGGLLVDSQTDLPGLYLTDAAWGDIDNDMDTDFIVCGTNGTIRVTAIYENLCSILNLPPAEPGVLSTDSGEIGVEFSWSQVSDDHTPPGGISYNLRVGTSPGESDVLSAMSDSGTGYRRIVDIGNAQTGPSWKLQLEPGTYYWSVQAIDGSFVGSGFAQENSFVVDDVTGIEISREPTTFALSDAAPNPFNPQTRIAFDLPIAMAVSLQVYDVSGRLVDVLMDDEMANAGRNEVVWKGKDGNGRTMPSGTYFYRLEAGRNMETKRMTLLK
ncbi:MAG: T9SS type A sorting domain-containing protein, partial [Gammaproteobacteria bacterium]|nr:T9SS type A sorting domain-containing protein [Gammaproteobacteria bacterium]